MFVTDGVDYAFIVPRLMDLGLSGSSEKSTTSMRRVCCGQSWYYSPVCGPFALRLATERRADYSNSILLDAGSVGY